MKPSTVSEKLELTLTARTWKELTLGPTSADRPHEIFEVALDLGGVVSAKARTSVFDSWVSDVLWTYPQVNKLVPPTGGYFFSYGAFMSWAQQSWPGNPLAGELLIGGNESDIFARIDTVTHTLRPLGRGFFKLQAWTPSFTARWEAVRQEIASLSTVYEV